MLQFWLAAVALLLLGYLFLIPALFARGEGRADRARVNLLLHRQRESELLAEGGDAEQLALLSAESSRNLLGDLEAAPRSATGVKDGGRLAASLSLLVLPAVAILVYLGLGHPEPIGPAAAAPPSARQMDMEDSIRRLAERLRDKPDDMPGWILLGRSLQMTGQKEKAMEAYGYALKLAPDDLDVQAVYAQALMEAGSKDDPAKPAEMVKAILKKSPEHQGGLWVAGLLAVQNHDIKQAVAHWERLRKQLKPDSPEARQMADYIAEAQGRPKAAAAPVQAAAQAVRTADTAATARRIRVKVSLAEALKAKAAPDDALFVFAKAAEGPPMPLAVVRKQVKDLPLEVELDESMGMIQGMNLASFDRLVVGARVSKSGRPTPAPGDLQGLTQPLTPSPGETVVIRVDQEVGAGG